MRKILLVLGLILIAAGAGYYWVQGRLASVVVVVPERGKAVKAVYASGTVEASVMVPIVTRTTARLVKLNVDEGNKVSKGDLLAQLDDADVQHSIQQLRAKEDYARQEFDRVSKLRDQNAVSKQAFDQAKTDMDAAIAATREAEASAEYLKLVAPEDGEIIKRDGEVGQMITPSDTVFWLSTYAPLRITAEVDEEDIIGVKPDMKVVIRADALPGQVAEGKIQSITPKGDPVARTYRVRISLPQDTLLKIGMTAETNIVLEEREGAMLVPSTAVKDGAVWVVEQDKLVQKKVAVGVKGALKTEIASGLSDDDKVVTRYSADYKAGEAVRLNQSDKSQL